MSIIKSYGDHYNLPGFGFQNDGFVGKGVTLKNSDSISRGVHLGNSVLIDKNSILKRGAIVGSHVIVGPNVEIDSSIVFDSTVVGEGTFLRSKLVYKNKVICPFSGSSIRVDQKLLLPLLGQSNYQKIIYDKFQSCLAFFFACYSFPVWLILNIRKKIFGAGSYVEIEFRNKLGEIKLVREIGVAHTGEKSPYIFISELFFASKFKSFCLAMIGEIDLIGASPSKENYESSVFTYSSLCKDPDLMPFKEVFDRFYQLRFSFSLSVYALFKIIFSRIILLMR